MSVFGYKGNKKFIMKYLFPIFFFNTGKKNGEAVSQTSRVQMLQCCNVAMLH